MPVRLPHVLGVDAAGVVDEVSAGVDDVRPGDEVFGIVSLTELGQLGGANAEYAVLSAWALKPNTLSWEQAGGVAVNVETAARALDLLKVGAGSTLLIEGAAGGVGTLAVQLAVARGATVIGTASPHNHDFLADLGAEPTTYGPGLPEWVGVLTLGGVDLVLDCVGSGSLPDLVDLASTAERVVTLADMNAAEYGVHLNPGEDCSQSLTGRFSTQNRSRVLLVRNSVCCGLPWVSCGRMLRVEAGTCRQRRECRRFRAEGWWASCRRTRRSGASPGRYEEIIAEDRKLVEIDTKIQFKIGGHALEIEPIRPHDGSLAAAGEGLLGVRETLELYAEDIGVSYNQVRLNRHTASKWPAEHRIAGVSCEIHRILEKLDDRFDWILPAVPARSQALWRQAA
nr:NADP-dependent oxidoreductase [Streptomyces sp. SAI-208]